MRTVDQAKHEAKRRAILKAAGKCFTRDGFQGTSTKTICAEAKISPGHLFHYFANKEEIISAMVEARLEMYTREFQKLIDAPNGLAILLAKLEKAKTWTARDNQAMFYDLLSKACREPKTAEMVSINSQKLKGLMAELFKVASRRGEMDTKVDPEVAALVVLTIFDGLEIMMLREPSVNKRAIEQIDKIIRGFLKAAP